MCIRSKFQSRHPGLTQQELFDLFKAAIKDDDNAVNIVIGAAYENLMDYDREQCRNIMELMVRREPFALSAFQALLREARSGQVEAHVCAKADSCGVDSRSIQQLQ